MVITTICLLVLALSLVTSSSLSCDMRLQLVDKAHATFRVQVDGVTWLNVVPPFTMTDGGNDMSVLSTQSPLHGQDGYGVYTDGYEFVLGHDTVPSLTVSVRVYNHDDDDVSPWCGLVWSTHFTAAIVNNTLDDEDIALSGWPAFNVTSEVAGSVAWANPTSGFEQDWPHAVTSTGIGGFVADGSGGGIRGGPLVMYTGAANASTMVVAPGSAFMTSVLSVKNRQAQVTSGVHGALSSVPAGHQYDTVMSYGAHGVTRAVLEWGERMRVRYAKRVDTTVNPHYTHLSYYTDNGAVYDNHPRAGFTYEQTMQMLVGSWVEQGLPVHSFFFDAFWKEPGDWVTNRRVFPHGLQWMDGVLGGMPTALYMDAWGDSVYRDRFRFVCTDDGASCVPDDVELWRWIMAQTSDEFHGTVFENDFLITQFFAVPALRTNITLARDWLMQMGVAATERHIDIMYCMPLPRFFMQSLEIPAVRSARVTNDYRLQMQQWRIGRVSLFASALGLYPFKDVFWSVATQPDNRIPARTQVSPEVSAVVSLYSTGPVGIGDGIHRSNTSLIAALCRIDGRLLQPDHAMLPIDRMWLPSWPVDDGAEVWSTVSRGVDGSEYWFVFAAGLAEVFEFECADLPTDGVCDYIATRVMIDGDRQQHIATMHMTPSQPLVIPPCPVSASELVIPYYLYVLVPLVSNSGWRVFGELSKLMPMSMRARSFQMATSSTGMKVSVKGVPSELVDVTVLTPSGAIRTQYVNITAQGVGVVTFDL